MRVQRPLIESQPDALTHSTKKPCAPEHIGSTRYLRITRGRGGVSCIGHTHCTVRLMSDSRELCGRRATSLSFVRRWVWAHVCDEHVKGSRA
jgi:hypothetical protein